MKKLTNCVVFDFDGTLVDTMDDFADIASRVISKKYGVGAESARRMYLVTSGIPFFQQLEVLFPDNPKNSEASCEFESEKLNNFFSAHISDEVKETIQFLRSKGMYVVISSNNFQHLVRRFIKREHFMDFNLVLGCRKNFFKGRDHFNYITKNLDVNNDEIVFVGDSLKDAERAFQSGIDFIGKLGTFTRSDFEREFPGVKTVAKISDLKNIFNISGNVSFQINALNRTSPVTEISEINESTIRSRSLEAAGVKKDEKKIMNGMKAVILAAGMGMRLKHHTNHRSKAMVSVNGTPLIDYAVNFALNGGISDINVVGGYMGKRLQRHVLKQFPDVEFVMNDNFRQGNILSLAAIFGKLKPPFVLMNVDHIYPYAIIKKLLASDGGIIAAVDFDRVLGPDDMKVKLNDDNEIVSISKQLTDFDGGYIGMTMVKEQGFDDYFEAFKQIMAKRQGNASVEEIIGHLASTENRVTICDMSGLKWLEVDTEEELFRAEETLSRNPDFFIRNFT